MDLEAKIYRLSYENHVRLLVVYHMSLAEIRTVIGFIKTYRRHSGEVILHTTTRYNSYRLNDVGDFIQVAIEDNGRESTRENMHLFLTVFTVAAASSENSATEAAGIGLLSIGQTDYRGSVGV